MGFGKKLTLFVYDDIYVYGWAASATRSLMNTGQ